MDRKRIDGDGSTATSTVARTPHDGPKEGEDEDAHFDDLYEDAKVEEEHEKPPSHSRLPRPCGKNGRL